jgi:hypothetical protein
MSQKYDFTELDQAMRRISVLSQWEQEVENYQNGWVCQLEDAGDGSGDAILTFPDELIMLKGWKEGTVINMEVEQTPTGNVLVITEKIDATRD